MAAQQSQSSVDGDLASVLRRTHINEDPFKIIHSEDVHNAALDEAYAYHANLREYAVGALRLHEAREAAELTRLRAEQEEERLRVEIENAKEECRLRDIENRARSIPKPAPRVPTPPPVQAPRAVSPVPQATPVVTSTPTPLSTQSRPQQSAVPPASASQTPTPLARQQEQSTSIAAPVPQIPQGIASPAQQPLDAVASQSHTVPGTARYQEIHLVLKQLRAHFETEVFPRNKEWAKRANDIRRKIRRSVGQLSTDKINNKKVTTSVLEFLMDSLNDTSIMVDPSIYLVTKPAPREGVVNNGDKLPAVYIWLLGGLAKAIIAQCVNEVSVNPGAADAIGVFVATVFSNTPLLWRGETLVDILISKFRVSCPVLFGLRGSDKTEQGRTRLGWKRAKDTDRWDSDEEHTARMSGIAAGYAAISLRDFSKARFNNPWPPSRYWMTLASICNTPADEISSTQFTVLKSLIIGYEKRFLGFFGTAGKAALKVALIDFPARANRDSGITVSADSLRTVASMLEKDYNLVLDEKSGQW